MKKIQDLIRHKTLMSPHVAQKVNDLSLINQYLNEILPEDLRTHCQIANIKGLTLVLLAENAHWATLLRFQAPTILEKIQARFSWIQKIEIKNHALFSIEKPSTPPIQLSKQASESLKQLANQLSDDLLKEAILKLASRHWF